MPEQVHVPCTQAGCSLHKARPSASTEPLLPLPECRHSPMNLPAQLDGGAAEAEAIEARSSELTINDLMKCPPGKGAILPGRVWCAIGDISLHGKFFAWSENDLQLLRFARRATNGFGTSVIYRVRAADRIIDAPG